MPKRAYPSIQISWGLIASALSTVLSLEGDKAIVHALLALVTGEVDVCDKPPLAKMLTHSLSCHKVWHASNIHAWSLAKGRSLLSPCWHCTLDVFSNVRWPDTSTADLRNSSCFSGKQPKCFGRYKSDSTPK